MLPLIQEISAFNHLSFSSHLAVMYHIRPHIFASVISRYLSSGSSTRITVRPEEGSTISTLAADRCTASRPSGATLTTATGGPAWSAMTYTRNIRYDEKPGRVSSLKWRRWSAVRPLPRCCVEHHNPFNRRNTSPSIHPGFPSRLLRHHSNLVRMSQVNREE